MLGRTWSSSGAVVWLLSVAWLQPARCEAGLMPFAGDQAGFNSAVDGLSTSQRTFTRTQFSISSDETTVVDGITITRADAGNAINFTFSPGVYGFGLVVHGLMGELATLRLSNGATYFDATAGSRDVSIFLGALTDEIDPFAFTAQVIDSAAYTVGDMVLVTSSQTAVPEPSSLMMVGCLSAILVRLRYRRTK